MNERRFTDLVERLLREDFDEGRASSATLIAIKELVAEIDAQTIHLRRQCDAELFINFASVMKKHLSEIRASYYAEFNFRTASSTTGLYEVLGTIGETMMSDRPALERMSQMSCIFGPIFAEVESWLKSRLRDHGEVDVVYKLLEDELQLCEKINRSATNANALINAVYTDRVALYRDFIAEEHVIVPDVPFEFFTALDQAITRAFGDVFCLNAGQQYRATKNAEELHAIEKEAQSKLSNNADLSKFELCTLSDVYFSELALKFAESYNGSEQLSISNAVRDATAKLLDIAELRASRRLNEARPQTDLAKELVSRLASLRDAMRARRRLLVGLE